MDPVQRTFSELEQRTVTNSLLPQRFYDAELGRTLLLITSPIELPFRVYQKMKDFYYHLRAVPHTHN